MNLFPWQVPSKNELLASLSKYGVAADGSEMGTGKMYKACALAAEKGYSLEVLCPKSTIQEWHEVAKRWGVPCLAQTYDIVRRGMTSSGSWKPGQVFQWSPRPANHLLVFDEAHKLGGLGNDDRGSQNAKMLIAATRQNIPRLLTSGTLMATPLKGYAIGHTLGLHNLTNYWTWACDLGVRNGFFGWEWKPHLHPDPAKRRSMQETQEYIRTQMGDKFSRIRKSDVPNFPLNQVIPQFVETDEMPDFETGDYGVQARQAVELLKISAMAMQAKELVESGFNVAIFVNFIASLEALRKAFPKAGVIRGGQSAGERSTTIHAFQHNEGCEVLLLMAQAGGESINLHDLYGRPRASLISPGHSAVEFLQILSRIHRAGALSPAVNYVILASGVPVERRIRLRLEQKIDNINALNDYDLYGTNPPVGNESPGGGSHSNPLAGDVGVDSSDPHGGPSAGDYEIPGIAMPNFPVGGKHHLELGTTKSGVAPDPGSGGCGASGTPEGPGAVPNLDEMTMSNPFAGVDQLQAQPATNVDVSPAPAVAHVERKHARCSPSKLKSLEICPSYEPDESQPPHPVTLRGTAMHEALETGIDTHLLPEEHDLVAMCRDFLAQEDWPGQQVILEPHLKTHDKDIQGFADRLTMGNDGNQYLSARIRDYKMGWNPVDAPDKNPQAIAYVVAVFLKYPKVMDVDFAFLIPRLDMVLQHTFKRSELPALKLRLSTIADRVRTLAGKEFNVNNDNCLYCGRKANCTALHSKALVIANGYNDDEKLPLPTEFHSSQITDPVEMAKALNVARVMQGWVDSVNAHALKLRLEVGHEIPGYSLIERSGKRTIVNTTAAWGIAQTFGVTSAEFMAAATVSLPQLETAVKAKVEKGKAKKAEEFVDKLSDAAALTRGAPFFVLQKDKKKTSTAPSALPT